MFCSVVISRLTQHFSYIIKEKNKTKTKHKNPTKPLLKSKRDSILGSCQTSVVAAFLLLQDADAFEHNLASALHL